MSIKRNFASFAIMTLAITSITQFSTAFAATVTTPATASISADSTTGTSVALPALVITESAAGDIPAGTLTWTLPTGYVFDTSAMPNVVYTGTGLNGSSTASFVGTNGLSVIVSSTSSAAGSLTIGSVTPLKVKAISGTPLAAAGNIMLTMGSLTGIASTTSYGLLTQVAGAPAKLVFTTQPVANVNASSTFSATVSVEDQFGNVVNADNSRNITLSAIQASGTVGTLGGTLTRADVSGAASFTGLNFNSAGQIQLNAASSGLTGATSSTITITVPTVTPTPTPTPTVTPTPTPTPTTGCNLHNGLLVKVAGSPTVYMVVNCVLRPFNTPALFHARGKKFQDIITIPSLTLSIGKAVGDGDDNDSTIMIPAPGSSTSTLPTISGLADGTLVKLANDPTVYIVSGGVLKPFTSLTVFKAHKKGFNEIKTISASQFASLSVGSPATFPDGTLLKGSDNTVYVVENGQLFGIPSMDVFHKHGWSFANVLKVNNGDIESMSRGGNED